MLLNNQEITEEIKEKIKKYLETNDDEHDSPKPMGCSKSSSWGKFTAVQSYLKKQGKSQINNLTLHLKQLEKAQQKIPKLPEGKKS